MAPAGSTRTRPLRDSSTIIGRTATLRTIVGGAALRAAREPRVGQATPVARRREATAVLASRERLLDPHDRQIPGHHRQTRVVVTWLATAFLAWGRVGRLEGGVLLAAYGGYVLAHVLAG